MWNPQNTTHDCPHCGMVVYNHRGEDYSALRGQRLTGQIARNPAQPSDLAFRYTYLRHVCLPGDVEIHGKLREKAIEGVQALIDNHERAYDQADYQDALQDAESIRDRAVQLVYENGLTLICPKCEAGIGEPCLNLLERKRGNHAFTKRPHEDRLPLAGTQEHQEIENIRNELGTAQQTLNTINEALESENALEQLLELMRRL